MSYDPAVLSRVRHLHLRARVLTDSLLMGEHRSRRVAKLSSSPITRNISPAWIPDVWIGGFGGGRIGLL